MMDNTEGTAKPADSVETVREVSIALAAKGKEQLQQEYDAVRGIAELAKLYGISFSRMKTILIKAGVSIHKRGWKVPSASASMPDKNQLQREYDAAGGIKKLGEQYGIPYGKMRFILMEAGVEIRKRGWNAYNVTPARIEGIRKRWEDEEEHERHREVVRKQWEDNPERRQHQSERLKELWADQDYREQQSETLRNNNHDPVISAKMHQQWDDPARHEQQRQLWLENVVGRKPNPYEFPVAEVILHDALQKASVSFTTNAVMLDAYIVDVLIHQRNLVIEVDGLSHAFTQESDNERNESFRLAGYEIVRFSNQQIKENADECVKRLNLSAERSPEFCILTFADGISELMEIKWQTVWSERRKQSVDSNPVRSAVDSKPAEAGGNDQPSV